VVAQLGAAAPVVALVKALCAVPAPGTGSNTCLGDSGGPVLTLEPGGTVGVLAVTSWGLGCGLTSLGFYERVPRRPIPAR
jgi:secreted trypsin-like serine protease